MLIALAHWLPRVPKHGEQPVNGRLVSLLTVWVFGEERVLSQSLNDSHVVSSGLLGH